MIQHQRLFLIFFILDCLNFQLSIDRSEWLYSAGYLYSCQEGKMTQNQRMWLVMFMVSLFAALMCTIIGGVIWSIPNILMATVFGLLFIYPYEEKPEE